MKLRNITLTASLAFILLPLAGLAYLGTFTRMHSDDFCIAASLDRLGFWPSIIDWYTHWAGRFMYFIAAHLAAPTGPIGAALFPAVVIVFWLLAMAWAFLPLLRRASWPRPGRLALAASGFTLLILLSSLPNIFQSIYWRDGQVNYTFPLLGLSFLAGLVLRAWNSPTWPTARYAGLAFLLAFVCGGFAEAFDTMQVAIIFLGLLAALFLAKGSTRRRVSIILGAALAGSCIAIMIVILAPGNQVRSGSLGEGAGLVRVLTFSLRNTAVILGKFVLWNPFWALLASVVPFLAGWWLDPALPLQEKVRFSPAHLWSQTWCRALLLVPISSFLAAAAACAPVVLIMNAYPEERTILLPQTVLVVAVVVAAGLLGSGLRRCGWLPAPDGRVWLPAALLALLVVSSIFSLWNSLSQVPDLQTYTTAWDRRDADMRETSRQGQQNVTFYGLNNRSGIGDLQTDPSYWINRCMADYYGFASLTGK